MKFFDYLKNNGLWLLLAWTGVLVCFFAYWLITTGWEESKTDIKIASGITLTIWIVYIVGDIVSFKKLK